jgi:hypothetical protein
MNAQCLKTINRVELIPNVPSPFRMRDWKGKPEEDYEVIGISFLISKIFNYGKGGKVVDDTFRWGMADKG